MTHYIGQFQLVNAKFEICAIISCEVINLFLKQAYFSVN